MIPDRLGSVIGLIGANIVGESDLALDHQLRGRCEVIVESVQAQDG